MGASASEMSGIGVGSTPVGAVGDGYDTFAFSARESALNPITEATDGAETAFRYTTCRDMTRLREAMNLSASMSGSYDFVDKLSTKATFFHSLRTTTHFVSVVVYVGRSAVTRPKSIGLAVQPKDESFFRAYGDSYVSSIRRGGELVAVYTFFCQSQEEVTKVTATLTFHGVDEGGSLTADVEAGLQVAMASLDVRQEVNVHLAGYVDIVVPDLGSQGLYSLAQKVAATEPNDPVVVEYTTEGYEHVPGFRAAWFDTVIANRQLFDEGEEPGQSLREDRTVLQLKHNDLGAVREVYDTYGVVAPDQDLFEQRSTQVEDDISALMKEVRRIEESPTTLFSPPVLPSAAWGAPHLSMRQVAVGPWGDTSGGRAFDDVSILDAPRAVRPGQVWLRGGDAVDMLIVDYVALGDTVDDGVDISQVAAQHGGTGGTLSNRFTVPAGHRPVRISVICGRRKDFTVIRSLRLEYAGLPPFEWPTGRTGENFSHKFATNEALVGFAGRAGAVLNQLAPVVVKFLPLEWETA